MNERKPGLLRRLFVGTWRVLDFSRRFILTVVFLFLVVLLMSAVLRPDLSVGERSVLVIAPKGNLVEEYTIGTADRALNRLLGQDIPEVRLRDVLQALEAAVGDRRIERVLLRLDGLQGAGLASLREIGEALDRVRDAGKQIVAYGDWYGQGAYYLAAHADEIYMHPFGMAALEGFGRFRTYFAGAFRKLGIEVRLFRVGEYKSAGETYIRNEASEEAREADRYWMNDLWRRYLAEVGAARSLSAEALQTAINEFPQRLRAAGGDTGRLMLDAGMVTELKTVDELRELLISRGVRDDESFRQVAMDDYLGVLERERTPQQRRQGPVAIVVAQGSIVDGEPGPGMVGGVSTSALIRRAREDDDVKALVLRIDSPGGGVFPSEQIRREVELTRRAGKPVVASMGDVAASGGYWIAMNADRIYADPATITGSIGVFGLWFNAPETMAMLGLNTDGVRTTDIAGMFDPTRPYDPRVGEVIQAYVDNTYDQFIDKVAVARGSSREAIDAVARGRVWSGAQAHERQLIDTLGGLTDAIAEARRLAGLPDDAAFNYIEPELTGFERFMQSVAGSALAHAMRENGFAATAWLPDGVRRDLASLSELMPRSGERPWRVYAHCQCAAY